MIDIKQYSKILQENNQQQERISLKELADTIRRVEFIVKLYNSTEITTIRLPVK